MDAMVDYVRHSLEAKARLLMAETHIARGFDSARERAAWLADVDAALDAWNAAADAQP